MNRPYEYKSHIGLDGRYQNIARYHTVFGGEAFGEIVGVNHLGIGWEFFVALPDEDLHVEAGHQLELIARIAVGELHSAHLLSGSGEGRQLEAEGVGRTGQHTAGVGLDIHFAPWHLPEGLPGASPSHLLALQQIAEQEVLGGQRRDRAVVQGTDGVIRVGNGKFPAQ